MAFSKHTWKDRVSQFPARRTLTDVETSESKIYSVSRAEGTVTEEGDPFSAERMNDLETRIDNECNAIEKAFAEQQVNAAASTGFNAGDYVLWQGKFYKVLRRITSGEAFVVGNNIVETKVGTELKSLVNSVTGLTNNVNNLTSSVNNSITNLGNRVEYINNIRPFGKNVSYGNFQMTNGSREVVIDCSDILQNRASAVTITAGQTGAVLGASLLDATRSAVRIAVSNLSNPSFTGTIAEVNIIVWGR